MITVLNYVTADNVNVFSKWITGMNNPAAYARITARIERMEIGNFGDCKSVGVGVQELRIDFGPGYRVYFSRIGTTVVLLLCAGDKRTQKADIRRATQYLTDYKRRVK